MNIVMVAGEVSGDLLGGKLAQELFNTNKAISISGIGGECMRNANVNTLHDVNETSVVGVVEVLKHYPRLRRILSNIKQHIHKLRPELLILIDYPEFNLKLAKYAKSLNIKVLYYVSPQVWAWRTGRVKKIKAYIDLMAVLFPFEVEFYKRANIPVCLVRHPLLEDIDKYYQEQTKQDDTLTIGLAPGSRTNEIKKLFPVMIEAAHQLTMFQQNIRIIVPVAPGVDISTLKKYNKYNLPIEYLTDNFYLTIKACDVIAISSGTATLQTALMGKAMVVIYKISPLTHKLLGHMIKVKHICLANIILDRRAYVELVQKEANAENLFNALKATTADENIVLKMKSNRDMIYKKLNSGINSKDLAEKAIRLASQ